MKHDYKAAREWVNEGTAAIKQFSQENPVYKEIDDSILTIHDTIRHALAMMQKLEEPSEGMVKAGWEQHREDFHCNGKYDAARHFKAMLEQAEKEITGE